MHPREQSEVAAKLATVQRLCRGAVIVALVLLGISLLRPIPALTIVRALAWAAAGVLSLMEASLAKQLGGRGSYVNAALYFLVALLPFLRGL